MKNLFAITFSIVAFLLPNIGHALNFAAASLVAPLSYIPVTLTNSQTTATSANLQVEVIMNSNTNSSLYAANLINVNWQDGKGNILPSWLESGITNTSTSSVYWINLKSNTIAASPGTLTIYQVIYATSITAMDGVTTGAQPAFSGTWGQYDSGNAVFTQYGGGSWSNFTFVNGTWVTTNGYLQQTGTTGALSGGPSALIESTTYAANGSYILETAFNYTTQAVARVGIVAVATVASGDVYGYRFIGQQSNNGAGFLSFLNDLIAWIVSNTYAGATATNYTMQVQDNGGKWTGTLFSGYGVTGASLATLASTTYTTNNDKAASTGYVGISAGYYNGSNVVGNPTNIQWFRMRNLPPNATLPSYAAAGSVSTASTNAPSGEGFVPIPF